MTNQPIPNDDHVSRYCKPSVINSIGQPMASAFSPRQDETYLSVNWLEYFGHPDLDVAIDRVRAVFQKKDYRVVRNGRFAVLNVGAVKTAAHEATGPALQVEHLPSNVDGSHAGILGYSAEDFAIATELAALVGSKDLHPAVI